MIVWEPQDPRFACITPTRHFAGSNHLQRNFRCSPQIPAPEKGISTKFPNSGSDKPVITAGQFAAWVTPAPERLETESVLRRYVLCMFPVKRRARAFWELSDGVV